MYKYDIMGNRTREIKNLTDSTVYSLTNTMAPNRLIQSLNGIDVKNYEYNQLGATNKIVTKIIQHHGQSRFVQVNENC